METNFNVGSYVSSSSSTAHIPTKSWLAISCDNDWELKKIPSYIKKKSLQKNWLYYMNWVTHSECKIHIDIQHLLKFANPTDYKRDMFSTNDEYLGVFILQNY